MSHEVVMVAFPEVVKLTEGNTVWCAMASDTRGAGVGDHITYTQTSSEPGKPGCVLRWVTGGGLGQGETGGLTTDMPGWRIGA